jgi:tetraacyldisaccharide 4'-kinase
MIRDFTGWDTALGRVAAGVYGAARRFDRIRRSVGDPLRIGVPVISVGNITVGGTGKTPMCAEVAARVREWGRKPVIVSRGWRGREVGPARVPADGDPARFGDEPVMLARRGFAVWIGRRREAVALAAAREGDLLILDDGFQRTSLARDLDLVMIGPHGIGNGQLLPAGILRDDVSELRRADALCGHVESVAGLYANLPRFPFGVRGLQWSPRPPRPGEVLAALAAIAYPGAFFAQLERLGYAPTDREGLPDHDPLTAARLRPIVDRFAAAGCSAVVVTEKDAVKLPLRLGRLEVLVARADWGPLDPEADLGFERFLRSRIDR